jgi:hypothetical protein
MIAIEVTGKMRAMAARFNRADDAVDAAHKAFIDSTDAEYEATRKLLCDAKDELRMAATLLSGEVSDAIDGADKKAKVA